MDEILLRRRTLIATYPALGCRAFVLSAVVRHVWCVGWSAQAIVRSAYATSDATIIPFSFPAIEQELHRG
jgi:hypothetical protein